MSRAKPGNMWAGPGFGQVWAHIFKPNIVWAGLGPGPLKYWAG
ncbi:13181_t:CDS:1, partial [Cetraspora pellucida]